MTYFELLTSLRRVFNVFGLAGIDVAVATAAVNAEGEAAVAIETLILCKIFNDTMEKVSMNAPILMAYVKICKNLKLHKKE